MKVCVWFCREHAEHEVAMFKVLEGLTIPVVASQTVGLIVNY